MPLIHSKSKKAMSKNIATEMEAGKPQKQSIAIAYSVKRRAPKKMADGGKISASNEKRPMPEERDNDAAMVSRNTGMKPNVGSGWTDQPTLSQARKGPRTTPLKHPSIIKGHGFSTRLADEEDDLQSSAGVNNGPQEQPPEHDNEMDADKEGPDTPSLHMKLMAEGGEVDDPDHQAKKHNMSEDHEYGGKAEEDMVDEPSGLESDDDMMGDEDDFMGKQMAPMLANGGDVDDSMEEDYTDKPDKGWGKIIFKAKGGEVEHKDSLDTLVDAIMKRMQKKADGGMVDLDENSMEQPNGYYPRNEDEVLKENYDDDIHDMTYAPEFNEHGDEREEESENKMDMVDRVRSKMAKKRAFR